MSESACIACGRPATLLCDFVIGFERDHDQPLIGPLDSEMYRCDAPICGTCGTRAGNVFFTGSVDTIDYCPVHAHSEREGLPLFAAEAARIRRDAWATLRRKTLRIATPKEPPDAR